MKKISIFSSLLLVWLLGAYYFPVPFFFISSIVSVFFLNNKNYILIAMVFSSFFLFFGMAMDPVSYIGDYSRYYLSFYRSLEEIFVTGKLYRFVFFDTLKGLGLGPQFYTGFSLFLNYFITIVFTVKFAKLIFGDRNRVVFLSFFMSLIFYPSSAIGNFESMLAFNLIYISVYFFVVGKVKRALSFSILAALVHPAAIPLSILMLVPLISYRIFWRNYIFFSLSAFFGIIFFLYTPVDQLLPFLGRIQNKAIAFLSGPWSEYIERRDYEFIIIAFIKIAISVFILLNIKIKYRCSSALIIEHQKIFAISMYLLPILSLCIFSRTLAERYIYFGLVFFIPLFFLGLSLLKIKFNKYFLCALLSMIVVLPQNIMIYGVLLTKSYTMNSISHNIHNLLEHEYKKAPPPVGRK